jgi:hypothetical protein
VEAQEVRAAMAIAPISRVTFRTPGL